MLAADPLFQTPASGDDFETPRRSAAHLGKLCAAQDDEADEKGLGAEKSMNSATCLKVILSDSERWPGTASVLKRVRHIAYRRKRSSK